MNGTNIVTHTTTISTSNAFVTKPNCYGKN